MNILNTLARFTGSCLIVISVVATPPAIAHETKAGQLTIDHAHARPNLPNRPSAGYLNIMNAGDSADRLLAAKSEAFGIIELHTVETNDGVMRMMPIEAIDIPAGGMAVLEPGGMHLMLFEADKAFKIGDHFEATLTFEKAGNVTVKFMIQKPKHSGKKVGHGNHGSGS